MKVDHEKVATEAVDLLRDIFNRGLLNAAPELQAKVVIWLASPTPMKQDDAASNGREVK